MPSYRFSKLARLDLIDIADYTVQTWGSEQAERYLDGLDECFQLLAHNPQIGRSCGVLHEGYRRMEHERHVIFYRVDKEGVLIGRVLHSKMLPKWHKLGDES